MATDRYHSLVQTFGKKHFEKVQKSKILVVGAGGIGCEILKNLVLSGFLSIDVIDLDTIDVSNLNRQFLFRPEHVGQPKAVVAAAAAKAFNPEVEINAHYGNIKDAKFGINYFGKFNVVLNALDNIDARRHVNRLCLAADIPLIDSGTTGYLGQVMPIFKGRTACYECMPKPTQKVYPICTIRSTPDKPVHCIVWAKECFKLLFGNPSDSMLYEDASTEKDSAYMGFVNVPDAVKASALTQPEGLVAHGKNILIALFDTEVVKRVKMDVYKTAKTQPKPTSVEAIHDGADAALRILQSAIVGGSAAAAVQLMPSKRADWDRTVWTDADCATEFILCLWEAVTGHTVDSLSLRKAATGDAGQSTLGRMAFDKDDALAMRFVCATSNLRSRVFSIPPQNFHDAKGVAGNIIPAIATTNAIVAGIQVLQAFKIINEDPSKLIGDSADTTLIRTLCRHTYCLRMPTRRGYYLQPSDAEEPVASCYVCNMSQITVQIDTNVATLDTFVKRVVKGKLGFNTPSLTVGCSGLYEEGDGADEDLAENLPLVLSKCPAGGMVDGTEVVIEDFSQNLEVRVLVRHVDVADLRSKLGEEGKEKDLEDLFIVGAIHQGAAGASDSSASAATPSSSSSDILSSPGLTIIDDSLSAASPAKTSGDVTSINSNSSSSDPQKLLTPTRASSVQSSATAAASGEEAEEGVDGDDVVMIGAGYNGEGFSESSASASKKRSREDDVEIVDDDEPQTKR